MEKPELKELQVACNDARKRFLEELAVCPKALAAWNDYQARKQELARERAQQPRFFPPPPKV